MSSADIEAALAPDEFVAAGDAGLVFTPGMVQGILLVTACWCTVLAAGLWSPVLPQMAAHFAGTPHIDLLVGFVATMPALSVAVLAIPFGRLADRIGQRRVLLGGLVIYGLAGIIPFWLGALRSIILARLAVGIGEAAVMTASTALILLIPSVIFLPQPQVFRTGVCTGVAKDAAYRKPVGFLRVTGFVCGLNFCSTVALFVVVIQMAFLRSHRGARNSADIGLGIAIGA